MNLVDVGHVSPHCVDDVRGAPLGKLPVEDVHVLQRALVVASPRPLETVEVDGVRHAEVAERAEELAVDCLRKADLCGDPAIEPPQDAPAVGPLWGCCQAKENLGRKVVEESCVCCRRLVVDLVYHDVVIEAWVEVVSQTARVDGLY